MSAVVQDPQSATVASPRMRTRELLSQVRSGLQTAESELDHTASILADRTCDDDALPGALAVAAERIITTVSTDLERLRANVEALIDGERAIQEALGGRARPRMTENLEAHVSRTRDRLAGIHRLLDREVQNPSGDDLLNELVAPVAVFLNDLLADWDNMSDEICDVAGQIDFREARSAAKRLCGEDADVLTRMMERLEYFAPGLRHEAAKLVETWVNIDGGDNRRRAIKAVETIAKSIPGVKV